MYEFVVIGKGLMGSAALRYLSEAHPAAAGTRRLAIVGPDEPADYATHDGVFASHYDAARLSAVIGRDQLWSGLSARAIARYPEIEQQSGICFHVPCGALTVLPLPADGTGPAVPPHLDAAARELGVPLRLYPDAAAISAAHPELAFPPGHFGYFEGPPAGWIDPRALIRAQLAIAQSRGAHVVRDIAVALEREPGAVTVVTRGGERLRARRVLVATNASANAFDVLPRKLALRVKGEMTIVARVDAAEAAWLARLPVVGYRIVSPMLDGIYLTPPARYPDGALYLKLGCDTAGDELLPDLAAMRRWVVEGNGDLAADAMVEALRSIIPGVHFDRVEVRRCLVAYTPPRKPALDRVDERLFVAVGGNGASAKCSDTLGQLAARLMLDQPWPEGFPREAFRAVYADEGDEATLFGPTPHISPACRIPVA